MKKLPVFQSGCAIRRFSSLTGSVWNAPLGVGGAGGMKSGSKVQGCSSGSNLKSEIGVPCS